MNRKKIIIWGASGQSLVLEEVLRNEYDIIALFDNNTLQSPLLNVPLYPGYEGFEKWKESCKNDQENFYFIVAIGGDKGKERVAIHEYLKSNGLIPASVVHPTAFVAYNVKMSEGAQILANTSVCVNVNIGTSVIINTSASVDHEGVLDQGVHIGPGAKLAGCVKVNRNTFIGTGCIILPRIEIGANCIIGAGSIVTKNIPDNVLAYGTPCRIVREID